MSIPTEFDKFKDVLFNGKILSIKHDLITGRDMPETCRQNILIKNLENVFLIKNSKNGCYLSTYCILINDLTSNYQRYNIITQFQCL